MSPHLDPQHAETRAKLRTIGPAIAGAGLIFTLIGLVSFFSSFGHFEGPRYFWCTFVGLPLIFVGLVICKFAFLGSMARYVGNEVAPVGKDMANYMADGTKGAVRTVAAAIGEGLRGGESARCPKCQSENVAGAKFCKGCGTTLAKTCPQCSAANTADSRFCDKCGQSLAE